MAVIKGVAIIAHVNGIAFTAGIVSASNLGALQSFNHEKTSELYELKNANGATITQYFYDGKNGVRVQVVPHGTTVAAARTSLDAWHLDPGTLVTSTDSDGNTEDNYNVVSSTQSRTNTGATVVDLVLVSGNEGIEIATAPIT